MHACIYECVFAHELSPVYVLIDDINWSCSSPPSNGQWEAEV